VNEAAGKSLAREHYLSRSVFDRERERIFFREWFCAGRAEELREAGDFLSVDVAGENVLVVRTKEGRPAAFYNICRHRGCRLSLDEPVRPREDPGPGVSGSFRGNIRCPYHSWTYGFDGSLHGAPFANLIDGFSKADFSLHPVGVDTWGGFVFVHLTPEDPTATLYDQLGPIPRRLERYPLTDLRVARRICYDVAANWKVIMENYNECYHCAGVHPELCQVVPAFKQAGGAGLDWDRGIPHREGAFTFTATGTTDRAPFPGLNEDERERHKGELAYPNLLLSLASDHVAAFVLWPQAPDRTIITCDFLFHPDEMARADFDPSDAIDFWHLVNRQDWRVCEGVQSGMSSRVFERGYFAPMEDLSLDIRRYVGERMDQGADAGPEEVE
jgi:glycine betaine catabolism A